MMRKDHQWMILAMLLYNIGPGLMAAEAGSKPVCVPKKSTESHPPLPELNVNAFTVEFRATMVDRKYTMWAKEYYDFKHNKVRMDLQRNGVKQGLLLDYEDNTYIGYEYTDMDETAYTCEIKDLLRTPSDNFNLFGFTKGKGSSPIPHVVSSQEVLQFAKGHEHEYKGETTVNGLKVNHWQSCITWENVQATFTLDYYFTQKNFRPLGTLTPSEIPVRAVVEGVMNMNGEARKFNHVYEYLDFTAYDRLPSETFSLPDFMICDGDETKWRHDFPTLPQSMFYILETVSKGPKEDGDSKQIDVDVMSVFHDAQRELVRTDRTGVTSINDFNTGVEYIIDQNLCSAGAINPQGSVSAIEENGVVKMKDRPETTYLKNKFYFSGVKLFRGITALSFAGKVPDSDEVLMAYLTENDKTPLGLVVKNVQSGLKTHYNVFNFLKSAYPENDDKDPFDIRRCIDSNKITEFDVTVQYTSDYDGDIRDLSKEIVTRLRDYIAQVAGCSVLQLSIKDYHVVESEREFQWIGFFLGSIPNLNQAKVENQLPIKVYDEFFPSLLKSIQNDKFKEKMVISSSKISFSFEGKSLRSKGKELEPNGVRQSPLSKFQRYNDFCAKTLGSEENKRILSSAYECARACLNSKWMTCNVFQYSKASKECTMGVQESLPTLARATGCDFYRLSYLSHFEEFPGEVLISGNNLFLTQASTAEVCARLCLQEEFFQCESFDFCEEEDRCQLYKRHYYDKKATPGSEGDEVTSCTHYSRTRLDDFKTIGSTDLKLAGQVKVEAESLQECAYLCQEDCAMFSSCLSDQNLVCKFVPASKVSEVKFEHDMRCSVHNAPDIESSTSDAMVKAKKDGKNRKRTNPSTKGFSGGAMAGVALAMIFTGAGVGALTIFLLRRFHLWDGF